MTINPELVKITITLNLIDQLCTRHPELTLQAANEALRSAIVLGMTATNNERPCQQEAAHLFQQEAIQSHLPPW